MCVYVCVCACVFTVVFSLPEMANKVEYKMACKDDRGNIKQLKR